MRKPFRIVASGALALCLSVPGLSTAAHADTDGLTASEIQAAVGSTFDLPSTSDEVTTTSDANSAAISTVGSTTVDVPKDSDAAIKLTSEGEQIGIDLPNANGAQNGTVTAPGIVAYPTADGDAANAVQADEFGAVRLLTVIKDASGAEEFQYKLDLPEGSSIEKQEDGSLKVATPEGGYVVAPPWAHDANGKHVWSQLFTDGESTIDLVVNHHGEALAYPITADPWFSWGWTGVTVHLNREETYYTAIGSFGALSARVGHPIAVGIIAGGGAWLADYARKRNMCLSAWKSYWGHYAYSYVRHC